MQLLNCESRISGHIVKRAWLDFGYLGGSDLAVVVATNRQ